jgi:L-asparaginase
MTVSQQPVTVGTPRIAIFLTGGTIDSLGRDRLDLAWYFEADQRLSADEFLARLPELEQVAHIEKVPFRRLASHALMDADWLELAQTIQRLFDDDAADGIVITHGTNTLEETAYFLHLVLKTDRPVVLVGAMRPASAISSDGELNLLNGVRVAADPASARRGVLVVLNDTIHSARDVTKTATLRVETFQARDLGPLGFADADGRVVYYHRPDRLHTVATDFDVHDLRQLPRVDVVVSYVGTDATIIEALVSAGARGLVSAGTGAGRPTPAEDAALDRAVVAGVVVCQASRTGSGRVVRSPSLAARRIVAADNLTPWKARVLLALALTRTSDPDVIQRYFDTC